MSTDLQLGPEQMDALREIGNIGAGNAATSLSQMMGSPVQMGIPTVKFLPAEDIAAEIGEGDEVVAAMFLGVEGDAPGHMLFVICEQAAHNVVDTLAGGPAHDEGFTGIEMSALQEVGNIMTGSYLGALSLITGPRLEPTPPAAGIDLVGALPGAALAQVAMVSDVALMLESTFGDDDTPSTGDFLCIPTSEAPATVLDRLGLGE